MGQALYRKYRSKTLDEVVGQEHITETLKKALKQSRINHAYLFTGPRGVGKTSVARILAHEINNIPYTDDSSDIDIIEIDAASNRRIDEIRELRDKVYVAPTHAKYKVYIIDEVHMLTTPAFNALLKTLEEPPEHVVFILATTDSHKLPETIISRTQRFSFRPVEKTKVVEHLRYIAEKEGINIDDKALEMIAEHGEGSFRDSISMLDQSRTNDEKVTKVKIEEILGIPPDESIAGLILTLDNGDISKLVSSLSELYNLGFQPASIAAQISKTIRDRVVHESSLDIEKDLRLLKELIDVAQSHRPEQFLEITLLKRLPKRSGPSIYLDVIEAKDDVHSLADEEHEIVAASVKEEALDQNEEVRPSDRSKTQIMSDPSDSNWELILRELKQRHNTLYGVVRMAQPKFETEKVILAFEFAFHEKKINQTNNKTVISEVVQNITGKKYEIECILDKSATPPKITISTNSEPKSQNAPDLTTINNIFEGAELLES